MSFDYLSPLSLYPTMPDVFFLSLSLFLPRMLFFSFRIFPFFFFSPSVPFSLNGIIIFLFPFFTLPCFPFPSRFFFLFSFLVFGFGFFFFWNSSNKICGSYCWKNAEEEKEEEEEEAEDGKSKSKGVEVFLTNSGKCVNPSFPLPLLPFPLFPFCPSPLVVLSLFFFFFNFSAAEKTVTKGKKVTGREGGKEFFLF